MTQWNRRLAQGDRVLVTGANGFIASHVIDVLLEEGYRVRGTLRREMPWLDTYFTEKYGKGRFESIVVPGMENGSAFENAVRDVGGIVHLASSLSLDPNPAAIIPHTIAGTLSILKSAVKEPSVKSVVIASSCSAAYVPGEDDKTSVDENSWNDAAVKAAWSDDTPADEKGFHVYVASKVESERAAWKWVEENNPPFAFNTTLPSFNVGAFLHPNFSRSTLEHTRALLDGNPTITKVLAPQWHINVRDDAKIHVAALLDPKVDSQRLFPFAKPFNWTDMIQLLHKLRPDNDKLPEPPLNEGRDTMVVEPQKKAEELLKSFFGGQGFISLEDSVEAGIVDLV